MRDDPCVPVRTWLRPSTYRELTGHARRRGVSLDLLLSKLADASLHPVDWPGDQTVKPTRKPRRVLTADDEGSSVMDVEKELAGVRRRVQQQIDRDARAALIRAGIDVDAEERQAAVATFEELGRAWRRMVDNLAAFAPAIPRGYGGGAR